MRIPITFGKATIAAIVLTCCSFVSVQAQVITDRAALSRAHDSFSQRAVTNYQRALLLSAKKNWPLTIHGKHGKYAVLTGVDVHNQPIYKVVDNLTSAQTTSTTALWSGGSLGLNLTGNAANMKGRLAIWDGGAVRGTHVELAGRVTQVDGYTELLDHATHVSGTMIATGVNPNAKGMAYQAPDLQAYYYGGNGPVYTSDLAGMALAAPNLYLSNHSYGILSGWNLNTDNGNWEWYGINGDTTDYEFGYYGSDCADRDTIAFNAPYYLMVQAAGNSRGETGPAVDSPYYYYNSQGDYVEAKRSSTLSSNAWFQTIPDYGNAKNVITIGAVEPIPTGYTQPSDVVMTYFSSWGPTTDGRIKPDIVADGDGVLSSIAVSDYAYDTYAGTSMATPNVTGSLFLLQQYYTSKHNDTPMRSSTVKALVIQTADEAGTSLGPDYFYGWGLLNTKKAAAAITASLTDTTQEILEKVMVQGTSDTLRFPVIASGNGKLMATIAWIDPAGKVYGDFVTTPELVNDLDVRILKVGSSVEFMPWVMNPASPAAAATKGDNKLDNVERVEADSVVPGATYIIEVTHKGTLVNNQQAVSVVISGIGGTPACTSGPTSSSGTKVDSLSISNVHHKNVSGCTTYSDFTGLTVDLQGNQKVPLYVSLASCDATSNSRVVKVYIDFQNDGNFTDAGDLVATSPVLPGGTQTWSTTFTTPGNLTVGNTTRMRIVAEETTDTALVKPCGTYGNGETQDYSVMFQQPSNDLGLVTLEDPLSPTCSDSSQIVVISVHNYGTASQSNFPVTAAITGSSTANLSTTYPGTVAPGSSADIVIGSFITTPGSSYTIRPSVNLSGDQDTANNSNAYSISISTNPAAPTGGTATECGTNTVMLNVTNADSLQTYLWYTTATGGSPIAQGYAASTTTVSPTGTYYVTSGGSGPAGPLNKNTLSTSGGYNVFNGNFVSYHASVPVTLESVKLYTRYGGPVAFVVADVDQSSISGGSFEYTPYTTTTINTYASSPNPQAPTAIPLTTAQAYDPADSGAVYYLNMALPAGSHQIIVESLDSATIFRNDAIASNPYPIGDTNFFAWTGNSAGMTSTSLGSEYGQYYYFFYDAKIKSVDCTASGARTEVTMTTEPGVTITQNGDSLFSSSAFNNQWYFNGIAINGATGQIFAPSTNGTAYTLVTNDTTGCSQKSNTISFVLTAVDTVAAPKGLIVSPNPTTGVVNISFTVTTDDALSFEVFNILGERLIKQDEGNFIGAYSGQLNLSGYADGVYLLKIIHGGNVTLKKILLQH
jgi:hypothetical protein